MERPDRVDFCTRDNATWGIGHSGGAALIAARNDPNIKAVILDMPLLSGRRDAEGWPAGLLSKAYEERRWLCKDATTPCKYVQVWDSTLEAANGERGETLIHGAGPFNFISRGVEASKAAETPWQNRLILQSLIDIAGVEPVDSIHKIAPRKLLHLAASGDPLTGPLEVHKAAFENAKEPKEFIALGYSHIANYFEGFEEHIKVQVAWAKENL